MNAQPSFVIEDQSEVVAFLEAELKPERRIDTHGAIVFLCRERAYKMKRAVKFPYMDFSTAERRAAMCAAEIDINRRLAPEIYLGVAPVRRRDGRLVLGDVGEAAAAAVDWLVVMRRFAQAGRLDRMAARGAGTPSRLAVSGARGAAVNHTRARSATGFAVRAA
ncbi:MAG: hypothetical protein IBJ17_20160 [Reyranella sp.]|nr:hypothetical protein [Reyranella sp.]